MDDKRQCQQKGHCDSDESVPHKGGPGLRGPSGEKGKQWYRNKKFLLSVIAGVGLFVFFLSKLDLRSYQELIRHASLPWIAASALFFCLQIVARAYRLVWVFDTGRVGIKQALLIQNLHVPLVNILPGGLGDASLLYLLKRVAGVNFGAGAGCYLVLRTVEFSLCILMFLALTVTHSGTSGISGEWLTRARIVAVIILFGVIAFYFLLLSTRFENLIDSLKNRDFPKWVHRITHFIDEIHRQIKYSLGSRGFIRVVMYTAVFYTFVFFNLYSVFRSLNAGLTMGNVFFFYALIFPFRILPIKGPMEAGTFEFSWVVLLVLMGLGKQQAVTLAFAGHTITVLNILVAFLLFGLVVVATIFIRHVKRQKAGA